MDIFDIDTILELIDKNKSRIKKELDMKIFDNDKLSQESDNLLQVLDYNPKTILNEKDIMDHIPIIKLKSSKIEKKPQKINKHVKLVSTPNIDKDSFGMNKNNNNRISNYLSKIESSEKNKESTGKKEKEINKEENDDEEEEEDYDAKLAKRQKFVQERENKKKIIDDDEFEIIHHKTAKITNKNEIKLEPKEQNKNNKDNIKLDVYLFKNKDKIVVNLSKKDTVKNVKDKIIQILKEKNHKFKNTSYKSYNLTINETDNKSSKKGIPLDDNLILYDLKPKSIFFVDNEKNDINNEKFEIITKDIKKIEIKDVKVDIKIFYNKEGKIHTKEINSSKENNLKDILNIFFKENILQNKNFELYYFIENKNTQDIKNAINLDTIIKNLPSYELKLCNKKNNNSENNINNKENDI